MSDHEVEPQAGLSSAASCISLSLLGNSFRPVYTHQAFDDERIRGYAPTENAIAEAFRAAELLKSQRGKPNGSDSEEGQQLIPHKSYKHHENASHRISLSVVLAPSCRTCALTIKTEDVRGSRKRSSRDVAVSPDSSDSDVYSTSAHGSKRQRRILRDMENGEMPYRQQTSPRSVKSLFSALERLGSLYSNCGDDDSSCTFPPIKCVDTIRRDGDLRVEVAPPPSGKTRRRRMGIEEIMERAKSALPVVSKCDYCSSDCAGEENIPLVSEETSDDVEDDFLSEPFGTILHEYRRHVKKDDSVSGSESRPPSLSGFFRLPSVKDEKADFVLCLADGGDERVARYHNQVQKLAKWFIETADDVNVTSTEGGGFWKILYLFRRHSVTELADGAMPRWPVKQALVSLSSLCGSVLSSFSSRVAPHVAKQKEEYRYSLVGYMTLFYFYPTFKKPHPGMCMRVCQAVILPPYQRAGHGKVMFEAIHDIAAGKYISTLRGCTEDDKSQSHVEIVEIDVEDPAPAFIALRDRVNFELLRDRINGSSTTLPLRNIVGKSVEEESYFHPLAENEALSAGALMRITPHQAEIALELYKRNALDEEILKLSKSDRKPWIGKDIEELERKYKVMVEKRLLKLHREDLSGCPTKKDKQSMLTMFFEETLDHYRQVLGKH